MSGLCRINVARGMPVRGQFRSRVNPGRRLPINLRFFRTLRPCAGSHPGRERDAQAAKKWDERGQSRSERGASRRQRRSGGLQRYPTRSGRHLRLDRRGPLRLADRRRPAGLGRARRQCSAGRRSGDARERARLCAVDRSQEQPDPLRRDHALGAGRRGRRRALPVAIRIARRQRGFGLAGGYRPLVRRHRRQAGARSRRGARHQRASRPRAAARLSVAFRRADRRDEPLAAHRGAGKGARRGDTRSFVMRLPVGRGRQSRARQRRLWDRRSPTR